MDLSHGGHLTLGHPANFSGKFYEVSSYGVDEETEQIDYDQLLSQAEKVQPKMITAGASAYPRIIDFGKMSEIAKSVNALLFVDMAHIAGLVAGGVHPSYRICRFCYNFYPQITRGLEEDSFYAEKSGLKKSTVWFPRCARWSTHACDRGESHMFRRL